LHGRVLVLEGLEKAERNLNSNMVISRCRGVGPPSGIVRGTLFLVASDLRRHPTLATLGLTES